MEKAGYPLTLTAETESKSQVEGACSDLSFSTSLRPSVTNAYRLVVAAYVFLGFALCKDVLFSSASFYPYANLCITSLAGLLGLYALLKARSLEGCRELVFLAALVLTLYDMGDYFPKSWGANPSAGIVVCGIAFPQLCMPQTETCRLRRIWLAACCVAGACSLFHDLVVTRQSWQNGVLLLGLVFLTGALMRWSAYNFQRTSPSRRRVMQRMALLPMAVLSLLLGILFCRVLLPHRDITAFIGQGIGTSQDDPAQWTPSAEGFWNMVQEEQGLVLIGACWFVLTSLLVQGTVGMGTLLPNPHSSHATFYAGLIGTLCGMQAAASIGLPFFSASAPLGTALLLLVVASLGRVFKPKILCDLAVNTVQRRVPTAWYRRRALTASVVVSVVAVSVGSVFINRIFFQVRRLQTDNVLDSNHLFVPLREISVPMQDATIAMEDGNFYSHHGFDWISLHRALRTNLRSGRIVEGGSTVTQQLAKNIFLSPDRTLIRKLHEAALTWAIERTLSKQRILELYMNRIDYGMGQHGIFAAAQHYFRKTPAQLTLAESAILVGIVPDPPRRKLTLYRLKTGRDKALSRIEARWSVRYTETELHTAESFPLESMLNSHRTDSLGASTIQAAQHSNNNGL